MRRQDLLATALDYLAKAQIGEGDLDAAQESLESELAIRKALVDVDPSNVQWVHHIGVAHMQLANLQRLRGKWRPRSNLLAIASGAVLLSVSLVIDQSRPVEAAVSMLLIGLVALSLPVRNVTLAQDQPHGLRYLQVGDSGAQARNLYDKSGLVVGELAKGTILAVHAERGDWLTRLNDRQ